MGPPAKVFSALPDSSDGLGKKNIRQNALIPLKPLNRLHTGSDTYFRGCLSLSKIPLFFLLVTNG